MRKLQLKSKRGGLRFVAKVTELEGNVLVICGNGEFTCSREKFNECYEVLGVVN